MSRPDRGGRFAVSGTARDSAVSTTTNKDLEKLIDEGKFRPDLFYRLNVFRLELPALRERREDIPALVDHFVRKFSLAMNKRITRVSPTAMNQLQQQSWLGNVRELENSVERAMVVGQEPELQEGDFAFKSQSASASNGSSKTLEDIERAHILKVVGECAGNQSHAADVLDIDRVTLYHKLNFRALVPDGLARPRVGARDAAAFRARPGVMVQNPVGVEQLHLAELPADSGKEAETLVHVTTRIRQAGAGDNNPAVHRRADEKAPLAGHSFRPRTRYRLIQPQRRLDRFWISRAHGHPKRRA